MVNVKLRCHNQGVSRWWLYTGKTLSGILCTTIPTKIKRELKLKKIGQACNTISKKVKVDCFVNLNKTKAEKGYILPSVNAAVVDTKDEY